MWATAPYLHNNSVGDYPYPNDPRRGQTPDLSIEGHLQVFQDSVEKLLGLKPRNDMDSIVRTEIVSSIVLPASLVPHFSTMSTGVPEWLVRFGPLLFLVVSGYFVLKGWKHARDGRGGLLRNISLLISLLIFALSVLIWWRRSTIAIGRIPAGTPVNLLLNITEPIEFHNRSDEWKKTFFKVFQDLRTVRKNNLPSLDHPKVPDLVNNLIKINKSPDFVLDRGHEFGYRDPVTGQEVPEKDKRALIEFLKTL